MNRRDERFAIADLQFAIDEKSNRNSQIANRKFVRYIVARGWLHLTLLCGVGIFMFPFVWMIGTSMKTDDEVTEQNWMPSIPRFVPRSPFVLSRPDVIKPMPVDPAAWDRLYD